LERAKTHNEDGMAILLTLRDRVRVIEAGLDAAIDHGRRSRRMMDVHEARVPRSKPRRDPPQARAA
jgi:hypothetical protein